MIQTAVDSYVRHLRIRAAAGEYSNDALKNVARDLGRFVAWGATGRPQELVEFMLANQQWRSNHTKKRVVATIMACFGWAAESGIIDACPYRWPKTLKLPTSPRREAERAEYIALMRHGGRQLRRALYFLHRTGARPCEMRIALKADIHWDGGVISLFRHKTARVTGQCRIIALDSGVMRFLRNIARRNPGSPYIFTTRSVTPWSRHTFARNLRRVAKRVGLDSCSGKRVSAYCLRHMFCGEMVDMGFSDRQIADQLGHADSRLIGWYSKNRFKVQSMRKVADEIRKRKRKTSG